MTILGNPDRFAWEWKDTRFDIAFESFGRGPHCLLLPAFSTVSSRDEMRPLAAQLAAQCTVTLIDWPGFGDSTRQRIDYGPDLFHAFLRDFLASHFHQKVAVVAAGHAAGYVLALGRIQPGIWSRIVLVAPTWRGPLPTAMHRLPEQWHWVRRLVHTPLIGSALYRLNTMRPVIAMMYRRHVYADAQRVTRELIRAKQVVARQRHARYASVAFVTGALDPVKSRAKFVALLDPPPAPMLIVYGNETPSRSRAEMEAFCGIDEVQSSVFRGSLGVSEEHPLEVFAAIAPFLREAPDWAT